MCSVVLRPNTPCPPMSAFSSLVVSRVLGLLPQGRFPSAPIGSLGFATRSQARQDMRPNQLSFVRTDRLAFRCSPPRLPATQLRLAFNQSSVWLRVFPPPLQMRSQAHIEVGRGPDWGLPLPPNRTCGSPASGSPVGGS